MHRLIIAIVALACAVATPAAFAQKKSGGLKTIKVEPLPEATSKAALLVRGSAALGFWDANAVDGIAGVESSEGGMGWGLGTGTTFVYGPFFGDLGIDYYDVSQGVADGAEFNRTDVLLTGGGWIMDWLSAFGGFRQGYQGDGAFNDDIWTESGLFTGGSVAFRVGDGDLRGSISLAYNLNKVDIAGTEYDYNGFSGKVRVALARTPHAVELRFQNFGADEDGARFRETYAFLAYVFNWQLLDF